MKKFSTWSVFILSFVLILVASVFIFKSSTHAATIVPGAFQARSMTVGGTTYNYQVFVPASYSSGSQKYPVIMFLHGSGESGFDNQAQTNVGLGVYIKAHLSTFPAIAVFPQMPIVCETCSTSLQKTSLRELLAMTALNQTLAEFNTDTTRIYLTGLSLGAFLDWDLADANPATFAAMVPLSGDISPFVLFPGSSNYPATATQLAQLAQKLKSLPIWIFHGALDASVPVAGDRATFQAFQNAGSPIKYTEDPTAGHTATFWDATYSNPALWSWLFSQSTTGIPISPPTTPPVTQPTTPTSTLPTVWTPSINISSAQRAVWAQMKKDYDANQNNPTTLGGQMYKSLVANTTCKCRYADTGLMAATLYQITGDTTYSGLAWQAITNSFLGLSGSGLTGNYSREYFIENVTIFDWIYNGITPAQRQQFFDKINEMAVDNTTNTYAPAQPIRTTDSDETIGNYFGITLWYELTHNFNSTIVGIWNQPYMGGLTSTGNNVNTMRNAVAYFVNNLGAGGEWMESSEYNLGTETLLLTGALGVTSVTGADYFPEVTALIPMLAQRQLNYITDDLNQSVQWGDEENARDFSGRLFYHDRLNAMLAGLTKGSAIGLALQDLTLDLIAKYPPQGQLDNALAQRWLYFFDPYAPRGDRTAGFFTQYASGMGTEFYHDGRGPMDSLFWAQTPNAAIVDHTPLYLGDFQLYRNGEWAITHPMGYAGASTSGHSGTNGMVIGGLPFQNTEYAQFHKPLSQEFGVVGNQPFAYLVSAEGGQSAPNGSWNPPATLLHEHSRAILYLPSSTKNTDTIVVYDRVNATANKEWYIHMPVVPSISSSTIAWSTAQNNMKVSMLLPVQHTATVINELTAWNSTDTGYMNPTEKKYSVRITPSNSQQWDTFLNVVQAENPGTNTTNTLVKSSGGEAEGVVVTRPGQNDVVVLFNARPSANLPQLGGKDNPYNPAVSNILANDHFTNGGYTITLNTSTVSASVLFTDLTPISLWSVSTDGGTAQNLVIDSQGIGKLNLSGAGSHTVTLTSSVNPNPKPTVVSPSTKFAPGDRVVITATNVSVRSDPAITGILLGTEASGKLGTIVSGGVYADGFYWWNINYDNTNIDGWSVEDYLTKSVSNPTPTPTSHTEPATTPTPLTTTPTTHTEPTTVPVSTPTNPVSSRINVIWTNVVNATANGNSLTKNSDSTDWNAGAVSAQTIVGGDGYVEFTAGESNTTRAIGLSNSNSGTSDTSIDFSVWLSKYGTYYCRGYGTSLQLPGGYGTYKAGDTFKVSYEGGVMKCYQNGALMASWKPASYQPPIKYPLFVDVALNSPGATIQNATLTTFGNSNVASVVSSKFNTPTLIIIILLGVLLFLGFRSRAKP